MNIVYRAGTDVPVFVRWLWIYRPNGGLFEAIFAQRLFHWRNVYRFLLVGSRGLLGAVLSEWASRLIALELPVHLTWTALVFLEGRVSSLLRLDLARPTSALISCILVLLIAVWTWQRGCVVELIGDHHHSRAIVTEEAAISRLNTHVLGTGVWIPAVIVFLTTQLLLLLVHLHDLHYGLLHLNLFTSLSKPIAAHLKSLVQLLARFKSELSAILVFLELILVEWWNVVVVSRDSWGFV